MSSGKWGWSSASSQKSRKRKITLPALSIERTRTEGAVMTTPDHLKPIEPAEAVHALCDRIGAELQDRHSITWLELAAFRETRSPHDARRLANALRHILEREDLAGEVEGFLLMAGDRWTPEEQDRIRAREAHALNRIADGGKLAERKP